MLKKNKLHSTTIKFYLKIFYKILPIFPGLIFFIFVGGYKILDPFNTNWIKDEDMLAMYLGWSYFIKSDWSFPLGLSYDYGLELSSSIFYSGSFPLFAFFIKFFFHIFNLKASESFHIFGIWIFLCFILQSYFGWKIIALFNKKISIRFLGAFIVTISPIFLVKSATQPVLASHFLFLWAIYLILLGDAAYKRFSWIIIYILSLNSSLYLAFIIGLMWLAFMIDNYFKKKLTIYNLITELIIIIFICLILLWQFGFFVINHDLLTNQYGEARANLLTLFDSNGWSFILYDIPGAPLDAAGWSYLGLGLIFLLPFVFYKHKFQKSDIEFIKKNKFSLIMLLVFCLYAISNRIGIGPINIVLPLPDFLIHLFSSFRASGRFFWPVYYLLIFYIIYQISRKHNSSNTFIIILSAALIQFIDTYPGWNKDVKEVFVDDKKINVDEKLKNPFWDVAPKYISDVRLIYFTQYIEDWDTFSYYAFRNKLKTNSQLLARYDMLNLHYWNNKYELIAKNNQYDANSLYIINKKSLYTIISNSIKDSNFILFNIDGYDLVLSCEKYKLIFNKDCLS